MRAIRAFVGVALVFASGCVQKDWIDRTLVTENVTGVWLGSLTFSQSRGPVEFALQQQGTRVTGTINLSTTMFGSDKGTVEGSMTGDVFTFKDERGVYSGELTVAGDDMSGYVIAPFGRRSLSLHRASQ